MELSDALTIGRAFMTQKPPMRGYMEPSCVGRLLPAFGGSGSQIHTKINVKISCVDL